MTAATLTWTAGSWITERRVRTLGYRGPTALSRAEVIDKARDLGLTLVAVGRSTSPGRVDEPQA